MKTGTQVGGELWVRCPYCGDSKRNPTKAHFSVQLRTGIFHCHRCKASGRLTTKQLLGLGLQGYEIDFQQEPLQDDELPELLPGAATSRDSELPRWRLLDSEGDWDGFEMFDPRTLDLIGVYLRRGKESKIIGEKGYSWPGAPAPILSGENTPIRLVEGPYDVLEARDVSVFGIISKTALADFYGHLVVMCPDGDVWQDSDLLRQLLVTIWWGLRSKKSGYLQGAEWIADGKDPDECPPEERKLLDRKQLKLLYKEMKAAGKL